MKKLLSALLLFAGVYEVNAQADPYHNSVGATKTPLTRTIESFGAIANDGIDDSEAFEKAANFFSNYGASNINYDTSYGVLILGVGEYIVGEQETHNSLIPGGNGIYDIHDAPKHGMNLNNLDGLIIKGAGVGGTVIKTKPGAYFGYFKRSAPGDPHVPTTALNPTPNPNDPNCTMPYQCINPDAAEATPGTIISLGSNAKNVIIEALEMNGNSDTYILGGAAQPGGDFNCRSIGIAAYTGQFLSLNEIYIHNFGLDGLTISASTIPAPVGRWNVTMDNVKSVWNGRQALSWVNGRDVKVENSTFGFTRLQEGSYDILSQVAGSPGLNVDIEPDGYGLVIRNGLFNNCDIVGNPGPSGSLAIQLNSDSITFNNCRIAPKVNANFQAIGLQSLWNRNITFNDCEIKGTIDFLKTTPDQQSHPLSLSDGLTKFINCSIEGCDIPGLANEYLSVSLIGAYDKVLFDNCAIKQVDQRPIFKVLNASLNHNDIPSADNYATLNNCTIWVTNTAGGFLDRLYGLRFTGTTTWSEPGVTGSTNHHFQNVTLNGSTMYSPMESFTFPDGNIFQGYLGSSAFYSNPSYDIHTAERPIIMGETPCEYLNVYLGRESNGKSAIRNDERPLYIGEGVTLIVRTGSALILSGDIYLAGKIVVQSGAYLTFSESYLGNDQYGSYPVGIGPRIHYLGSTSPASHFVIDPNAILAPPPFVWVLGTLPPTYVPHANRSELMAPNQYLRSAVVANRAKYDDSTIKCQQCSIVQTTPITVFECLSPKMNKLHPLKGIADADFYFPSNDDSGINIYPNPTNDKVNISMDNSKVTSDIQLLDINGRLLYATSSKDGNEVEISLSKYPQGTYLIRISNETNTVVKKVVKVN